MSAIRNSHFNTRMLGMMGFSPQNRKRGLSFLMFLLFAIGTIAACWPLASRATSNNDLTTPVFQPRPAMSVWDSVVPGPSNPPKQTAVKSVPEPLPEVVVEMTNRRVLYIGLDNPLRVLVDDVPADELVVRLLGPGQIQGDGINFQVRVTTPGEVTIAVYRRQKNREVLFQQLLYQVKKIPDPTPLFAGLPSRKITIAELLQQPVLSVDFDKVEFEVPYEIVSYELTLLHKRSEGPTFNVRSAILPEDILTAISQLEPGASVFLDDIKIKYPGDTEPRNIGGLVLTIVE